MQISEYFAVMDPASRQKLSGEFRARFDGDAPASAKEALEKEVHFSLCEVLNFSGRPVREVVADLPALSEAVTKEARAALAKAGALGTVVVEDIRFHADGEEPLAAWSKGLPRFKVAFAARDPQTGLQLGGKVRGRFVGPEPLGGVPVLQKLISAALHRVLARAEGGIVPLFLDIQRMNDEVSREIAPYIAPPGARGQVVIEDGEYDEASLQALSRWKAEPKKPVRLAAGARVHVTAWNGKSRRGKIDREGGGQFLVMFDDGGQAWVSPQHLIEVK